MIKRILISILFTIILASNVFAASLSDKTLGDSNAQVTLELFDDFQGPFGARWYTQTFPLIKQDYIDEGKVKLVVRHFPLSFHQNAKIASIAAECAAEQGEFFDYIDFLYNNQDKLSEEDLKEYARKLNLNIDKFTACFSDEDTLEIVEKDIEEAQNLGVSGTPTFFINDEKIVGAYPYSVFQQIIDAELGEETNTKPIPIPEPEPIASDLQPEPVRGNQNAEVHIVGYMGYNDPFSRRAWDTLDELFDEFEDNIKFEFRNFPLSFQDPNNVAAMSGECVLGLSDSVTFFEFSDKVMRHDDAVGNNIFGNRVEEDDLIKYGKRVGVDIESCLDNIKFLPEVLDDIENGQDDDVRGTPTFFINKEKVVGAQPYNVFANIIRKQLGEEPKEVVDEDEEEIEIPSEEEEIETQVCAEGKIKTYSCTDGTDIDWCECIGNKWICVSSPQILCPLQKPLCTTGCNVDGKCIPYGQRLLSDGQNSYCGLSGNLETQKLEEASCQNNYECVNNQCSSGQCTDISKKLEETTSLLEKILDFFKRLFGG